MVSKHVGGFSRVAQLLNGVWEKEAWAASNCTTSNRRYGAEISHHHCALYTFLTQGITSYNNNKLLFSTTKGRVVSYTARDNQNSASQRVLVRIRSWYARKMLRAVPGSQHSKKESCYSFHKHVLNTELFCTLYWVGGTQSGCDPRSGPCGS